MTSRLLWQVSSSLYRLRHQSCHCATSPACTACVSTPTGASDKSGKFLFELKNNIFSFAKKSSNRDQIQKYKQGLD
jgi:hypothetical protein